MKIDLSQFVGKKVDITLRDRTTRHNVEVKSSHSSIFPYIISGSTYTQLGNFYMYWCHGSHLPRQSELDIVKIELSPMKKIVKTEIVNPEQPKQMPNALEPKTLNTIASALTPEAIKYIESHEKYAEVMQALIIEFVGKNVGVVNGELPFMIFDRMFLAKGRD